MDEVDVFFLMVLKLEDLGVQLPFNFMAGFTFSDGSGTVDRNTSSSSFMMSPAAIFSSCFKGAGVVEAIVEAVEADVILLGVTAGFTEAVEAVGSFPGAIVVVTEVAASFMEAVEAVFLPEETDK